MKPGAAQMIDVCAAHRAVASDGFLLVFQVIALVQEFDFLSPDSDGLSFLIKTNDFNTE